MTLDRLPGDEPGGPFVPGDRGLTGLEVTSPPEEAPGTDPSEAEPTDNSSGGAIDVDRLEAIEDTGRSTSTAAESADAT